MIFKWEKENLRVAVKFDHVQKYRGKPAFTAAYVALADLDTTEVAVYAGYAILGDGDNYNKAVGRKIALERAVAKLPAELREVIWGEYKASGAKL